jgi:ribosomal protein S18 acetylase RimI-like enzyme
VAAGAKTRQYVAKSGGTVVGFIEVSVKSFGLGVETVSPFNFEDSLSAGLAGLVSPEVGPQKPVPLITNLCVSPPHRRSGVATQLVRAALAGCADLGSYPACSLQVESDNGAALSFYRRLGFKEAFRDPACRRLEVKWWGIDSVRTTKVALRKELGVRGRVEDAVGALGGLFR